MYNIQYFKIPSRANNIIEQLQQNGCFVCQDITKKYVYMRNQKNISNVISFEPAVYNNMMIDFDPDFDDDYSVSMRSDVDLSQNIKKESDKGSYIDLTYEKRSMIFKMPEDLDDLPKDVFITVTKHDFSHVFQQDCELTTIHLTQSNEGLGEVNEGVDAGIVSIRSILAQVDCDIKIMPIKDNVNDHYVLIKYADKNENNFTL